MIVTVTAYVHAERDYVNGGTNYKLQSFSTPLPGTVCLYSQTFQVTVPDDFDVEVELEKRRKTDVEMQLVGARAHVAMLEKKLSESA